MVLALRIEVWVGDGEEEVAMGDCGHRGAGGHVLCYVLCIVVFV